jgi:uncharacterized membrane protein YcaP (DUF421 family)
MTDIGTVFDLRRLFLGDLPLVFLLEIVVRTIILYVYALVMLRLIGKRGMRQLSAFDFAIIIALGSSVGDPMFYPHVPLLHGMTVISVIVVLQRLLAYSVVRSERAETFVEGKPLCVVHDGRLRLPTLEDAVVAREELFSVLRNNGAQQLGQVQRAYLEQSGSFSVFLYDPLQVRPGLPLIPPWDIADLPTYYAENLVPDAGPFACCNCGETVSYEAGDVFTLCPYCHHQQWTPATKDPLAERPEPEESVHR